MYTPDKLNDLMGDSDYVVMALPYTESTHHLVNTEAVNSMRSHGVLINVGRGKTLEQDAVVKGTTGITLGFTLPMMIVSACHFEVAGHCAQRVMA